jgi:hypothetical protein
MDGHTVEDDIAYATEAEARAGHAAMVETYRDEGDHELRVVLLSEQVLSSVEVRATREAVGPTRTGWDAYAALGGWPE